MLKKNIHFCLSIFILVLEVLRPNLLYSQVGPGLGNLTYTNSELNKGLWTYTEVNHYGSTMATMHNGYMITTFHPDSGKPPGGILVWDVSNPRKPVQVARVYNNQTSTFREQHALPQYDKYIMMQDGFGFQIWDFSNPLAPVQTKRHVMSGYAHDDYGSCWQIFWQAPYVFIANGSNGFDVVDCSNINSPVLVKHITSPRQVGPIFAIGNLLYTSAHDFGKGFTIYDISNPRDPKLLNSYSNTENMYASTINGGKMIISARGNTNNAVFGTYDVSDPLNIKKITTLNIGNSAEQLYCSTQDDYIFQGCQNEIVKIDASVPTDQRVVGRGLLVTTNPDHGQVTPFGNLIFGGNDHGSGSGFFVHQTSQDKKAPEVNMVVPKSNDVNRALTSRIGITLTDNIQFESINKNTFIVRPLGGTALSGKYSYQFSIVNFAPDQPLLANTTYEVVIPAGGMKDYAGNAITTTFTSYFSTGATGSFPPSSISKPWVYEDDKKVTLYWNASSNTTRYIIKRSSSSTGTFTQIGTSTTASYIDNNVTNEANYYYTITPENSFGQGTTSVVVYAKPAFYISSLNWESATSAWGSAEKDQSNGENSSDDGNIISLNGTEYSRGLGVHANSAITYNLGGKYDRFLSDIGVDDEVGNAGSVIFTVTLDGKQLYTSGLMTGASANKSIDIDVSGGSKLVLTVSPDGDNGQDHASWGGARLKANIPQSAYNGIVHPIPGIIQLENFDIGGNGFAYLDNTAGSAVTPTVNFRTTEDVDIETCTDTDGGYNIGYATAEEWLEYTVNVQNTGIYDLNFRVACNGAGRTVSVNMDGTTIANNVAIPNTTGWQIWETVTVKNIPLTTGQKIMRLTIGATDYVNLNYIEFKGLVTDIGNSDLESLTMYPNPFGNEGLTINTSTVASYKVYNLHGTEVEQGKFEGNTTIGKELAKGVYVIKLNQNGNETIHKIVKK